MPSSRLFWKLFLATAGAGVLAIVGFSAILSSRLQNNFHQQVDQRLQHSAKLIRGQLLENWPQQPSAELQQRLREYGEQTGIRHTIIASDGTVLSDSHQPTLAEVRTMASHRDRPEIVQARMRGNGTSTRPSATTGAAYRYFAEQVEHDGQTLYVRTALPMAEIGAQIAATQRRIWGIGAVVGLLLVMATFVFLSRMLQPLGPLIEAADAIAAGAYQHRIYGAGGDEFGMLARTLNRMSRDLQGRTTQLSQTGERHSTVLGGMIEGVIAVDERHRIALANKAAGRLFGFDPLDVEGRPLLEVVRSHALNEALMKAITANEPQRLETKSGMLHPTSGAKQIDIHVQPLPGTPCPGAVLVMHDTTELRRLESLRRDFMANVSHELKTPLSSIKAYTETLRNGALRDGETAQRFLGRIEEQTERLHRLIMDMLMLARIESDQQPFEIVAVDVAEVASGCVESHRQAASAKQITLTVEPDSDPYRVRADREGLREILDNLVDNAIKYTPEGGQVTISWRREEGGVVSEEGGMMSEMRKRDGPQPPAPGAESLLHISVRDTGIGIKAKDQARVFERFYRVDRARSRELGGTGLGLAIVKHMVQSFGGSVSVESEEGHGSTFTVTLPAA